MRRILFASLTICLFAVFAVAQSTTGRLLGNVSGPDGLLPGATLTVTDGSTGLTRTTTTNASGAFAFERLPFGVYQVKVTADGFKSFIANSVRIDANQNYTLNPKLEIGDVNVVVTVDAGAALVNTNDGELSSTVDQKQIVDLPINGRNPLSLLSLQAGVNTTAGNHVNGQRTSSTNFTRDGVNVQDNFIRTGGFVQDRPLVDDTAEISVVTQNASADLGGGGSAQIQLITPRGGSDFSGAGYLYNRNSYFAANDFGNNAAGKYVATDDAVIAGTAVVGEDRAPRPFLNRNQFGGKISGPLPIPGFGQGTPILFKDKAFFFVNYERFSLRQQTPKTATTLRSQFRDGTFTYLDNGGTLQTVNILSGAGLIGGVPLANGGSIGVNPIIQSRVLNRAPGQGNGLLTNGVTGLEDQTSLTQRLAFNQQNNDTRDSLAMRFDVDINDRNSVYFIYKYNQNADDRTDIDNTFNVTPVNTQGGPTHSYNFTYTTFLGNSFTNEMRVAYNSSSPFFNQDPNFPTDFVIDIPLLTDPQSKFQRQGRDTQQYTFQNTSSYTTGSHTMRFGLDFNAQRILAQTNFDQVGTYSIGGNINTPDLAGTLFPGGIDNTQRARANSLRFLLGGFVSGGSIAAEFVNPQLGPVLGSSDFNNLKYDTYGLFFTDQWRVTSELTLNLGVRWDYFSPLVNPDQVYLEPDLTGANTFDEIRTRMLDPNGQYVIVGTNTGTPGQFFNPDYNNVGPVVSFAYAPREKGGFIDSIFGESGVIRGGFRIGYINDEYVRGPDNAAGGNAGLDLRGNAIDPGTGTVNLSNIQLGSGLPGFTLPTYTPPPISFATGNANAGNFFNTVFAVDPNIEMQQNYQYSVGFSREIGFNTAIEFRYVGGRSDNMVRGFDFNQVNINNNGFLNEFQTARNNCRLALANLGLFLNDRRCTTAEIAGAAGLPGQVFLDPTFGTGSPVVSFAALAGFLVDAIQTGQIGQFALNYITNGFEGYGGTEFRANQNAGVVDLLTNDGRYRYNAFQFEVRRRFTDGLQFQANYTFGKTLGTIQGDGQSRFDPFLDINNPELEYARVDYDRTHTININANYELPFGKGKRFLNDGGFVNTILGGWQLTSIVQMSSGVPISIESPIGTLNRTGRSGRQTANSSLSVDQIRDLVGLQIIDGTIYYIDPSVTATGAGQNGSATNGNYDSTAGSFGDQVFFNAQPGQTGTLPRNFLDGPWYYNIDTGLIKNTRIGERFNIQFRAEAFNLLNNTNFFISESSGIFNINSTTFGQIDPASNYGPRVMQFAVRLEF